MDEISSGDIDEVKKRVSIVIDTPKLAVTKEVDLLATLIMKKGILPTKAEADAVHISIAAVYKVDFLLTWNCKHLANAQILRRLRLVLAKNGIEVPTICTPAELLGEMYDV